MTTAQTTYIPTAHADMSIAQVEDIMRRAGSEVYEASQKTIPDKNSPESKVAGDLAMEIMAPGAKVLTAAAEFLDERSADKAGANKKGGIVLDKASARELFANAATAGATLREQPEGALGGWKGTETKMGVVKPAAEIVFANELAARRANEMSYQSALGAQAQHKAYMGAAIQLAPGMDMSGGPSIRPAELLSEARRRNEESERT